MNFSLLGATLHISPTVHRLSFIPSSPPVAQCLSLARLHDGLCAAQFLRFCPLSCPQRWTECVVCSEISELRTFWLTTGGRVSGKGFPGFNPEEVMGLAGNWKFYRLPMQLSPKAGGSDIKDSGVRGP